MRRLLIASLLIAISGPAVCAAPTDASSADFFEMRIHPILAAKCWSCHGPEKQKGNLRLDSRAAMLKGGDTGQAIVPGEPEKSLMIAAVRHTGELKMPAKEKKLSDQQIGDLAAWVKGGAAWPAGLVTAPTTQRAEGFFLEEEKSFWSFQPLRQVVPPAVKNNSLVRTPIDTFVLSGLEAKGLSPAAPADRRALLRRVSFDLTGLPPSEQEIDAFLKDNSADAFAKVLDRLLASPHYGERWGRHWLDVVRYAETTANDANAVMRYAWRYRDYVVDAFNRDVPFDQFIVEQLAGDLLPPSNDMSLQARRIIATGFLMIGPKALAETDKEQSRLDIVDDQIDVTGRAFLGLTFACARCHDHKFDPIRAADYYALAGIFRSTEPFRDENRNATMWWEFPLIELPGQRPVMVMAPRDLPGRDLAIHVRGSRFNLGRVVQRGLPKVLAPGAPAIQTTQSGRLELARWIASRENPLTARVMVNRIWQHHFGTGLVSTSDNFGSRGERPTHPELLDYLARRFIESGWSVKAMHRLILMSETYQQSSATDYGPLTTDYSHFNRRRLDAEEIRDAMLSVSGKLDRAIGGSDASDILWKEAEVLDAARGFAPNRMTGSHPFYQTFNRRSIYLPVVRNMLPDCLALFDAADPNGVSAVRNDTTVPSQSLYMLNSPFVREQSLHLAQLLLGMAGAKEETMIGRAYVRALGRPATTAETAEVLAFLKRYSERALASGKAEPVARLAAWQSFCQMLFCSNEFMYVE